MPPTPPPKYLSSTDLALALGVKYSAIRSAMAAGIIPAPRAGRYAVFAEADLPVIRAQLAEAGLIAARPANAILARVRA